MKVERVMATKTAKKKAGRKTATREPAINGKPRHESWKKVLERNLIREGVAPEEAKELVEISASW